MISTAAILFTVCKHEMLREPALRGFAPTNHLQDVNKRTVERDMNSLKLFQH
jgi:hypothetical protein